MKKKKLVRIFVIVALVVLNAVIVSLLLNEYKETGTVAGNSVTRAVLIVAGSVLTVVKTFARRQRPNRGATFYRTQYGDLLGEAYKGDPKGEKQLVRALNAFNQNKSVVAIKVLDKMWRTADGMSERFAVATFTALCYDDMQAYPQAIAWYERAAALQYNTTVLSNMGLCHQRMGNYSRALEAYERAIKADPKNAHAYSNVANLYIREAEYEGALEYAEKALAIDANLLPAHSARAVAYAGLGDEEAYEKALRQAASAGADRKKIETAVRYILDEND